MHADTYKDSLGRQNTVKIKANNRAIMIVTLYRLPDGSRGKLNTVKAQFDKKNKVTKTVK